MGFFPWILETDSLRLFHLLSSASEDMSELGVLAMTMRSFLVPGCSFSFTPRSGNSAAHGLAKLAMSSRVNSVWLEEWPCAISDIVLSESLF